MFGSFSENRKFIENEFAEAKWDIDSGLPPHEIEHELKRMYEENTECMPILRAKMHAYILDNVQLEINPLTPFSAKINIGVNYEHSASQDFIQKYIYHTQLDKVRKEILSEDEYLKQSRITGCGLGFACTDFWHTVPDWNNVIRYGIAGLLDKARQSKEALSLKSDTTEEQITFLDSVIICYEAMIRLMSRIHRESLKYEIPAFSECILNLTQRPPETLYEVMQTAILFLYFEEIGPERARSLGPIDRLYLPYFENDLKNGIDCETLKELFRYFFIHFTASKRFAQQPMMLGGSDCNGNTYCNSLTSLILEIYDEMNIYDPKIHLRYHKSTPDAVLGKVLSMIRHGNSSICILNDDVIFKAYDKMNVPREDSQHYVPLGCYEPIIMGMEEAEIGASWMSVVKPLEFVFNDGKDIISGYRLGEKSCDSYDTFEQFMDEYYRQLDYCIDFVVDMINKEGVYSTEINPSPIYSSTFDDCLKTGTDIHRYPIKYNNISIKLMGLATLVDSLYAVKKYVYDTKEMTYAEMKDAVLNDWEGHEDMRRKIASDKEKYGNNMEGPDAIFKAVTEHMASKYAYKKIPRGGVLRLGTDSIKNCISYGAATAATPNGRKKGKPLSKNLCSESGNDRNGIISYMQTVLKMDASNYLNSAVLDFMLHPSAVSGEKGLNDFMNLVKTYFSLGGFAVQGNIVSGETLKQALQTPEKYSTLQIRVCGWNEYFLKMNKNMQEIFLEKYSVN